MFRIGPSRSAAVVPLLANIADSWNPARILQHLGQVHQVERHKSGVALREDIVETHFAAVGLVIAIGWTGSGLTDPPAIGLWRDHQPDMLHCIKHSTRDMLDPIFVPGHHAATDLAVEAVLPLIVGFAALCVEFLDESLRDRALLPKPDRRSKNNDVRAQDARRDFGSVVAVPTMFGHIGVNPGRQIML